MTTASTRPPNLDDYDRVRASFTWEAARAELDGLPGGRGLNIAHEAVDRHAAGPQGDRVALRWLGKSGTSGESRDYTYRELRELTDRFANVLDELDVARGERVFDLSGDLARRDADGYFWFVGRDRGVRRHWGRSRCRPPCRRTVQLTNERKGARE
jgi:hypothetical protein